MQLNTRLQTTSRRISSTVGSSLLVAVLLRLCFSHVLLLRHSLLCSTKGAAKSLGNNWSTGKAAWVSALVAIGTSALTAVIAVPILMRMARKRMEEIDAKAAKDGLDRSATQLSETACTIRVTK